MTNPFQVNPGGAIQQGNTGTAIAQGLAGVLAQMQQDKENQFRMQELQNQMAQQQALQKYYEALARAQQDELNLKAGEQMLERAGRQQVGQAQRRALGGAPGVFQPSMSTTKSIFQDILQGGASVLPENLSPIFGGVADENLPEAVKGVQEVQQLQAQPKGPELATSSKEFEYYNRLQQTSPERAAMYKTLFLDPKPTTQITNIAGQGESEFSKEWAKAQVAVLTAGEKEARTAVQSFPALTEAYGLVGKSFTGFGANQVLGLARAIGVGVPKLTSDKVANTQTLMKLTRDQVISYLQTRALGSGTAVSDADRVFMERQAGADISLDPFTIKRIIRINVGTGIERMELAIKDLREQAMAYPQNAVQLEQKAKNLEARLNTIRAKYAEMQTAESKTGGLGPSGVVDSLFPMRR